MRQRHYFIIPAGLQGSANAFASEIGIDPEGKLDSFTCACVPLEGPEDAPPTHYIADGQLTEEIRVILEENQNSFPGAQWWRILDGGPQRGELMATNTEDTLGDPFDFEAALVAAGLKRRSIT